MIISGYYYNNNYQEKQQKKIIYIDLDTTFTAYLRSGLLVSLKRNNSIISQARGDTSIIYTYLPTERTFESILKDVISSMADSSIVIFDSVNSFYNMYYNKIIDFDLGGRRGISRLNHLLSIFLMLLLKHGISLNIPILATSMIRYKKKDGEWKMSLTSKRILQRKSIVNLNVEMINDDDLSVTILQHPTLTTPQTLIFNNQSVKF
jgi:hypothetical protein